MTTALLITGNVLISIYPYLWGRFSRLPLQVLRPAWVMACADVEWNCCSSLKVVSASDTPVIQTGFPLLEKGHPQGFWSQKIRNKTGKKRKKREEERCEKDLVALAVLKLLLQTRHTFLGYLEDIRKILCLICFLYKMTVLGLFRDVDIESNI